MKRIFQFEMRENVVHLRQSLMLCCRLAVITLWLTASCAEAHIDFGVQCSFTGGTIQCQLVPILREEQFLFPVPLPVPFPPGPCDSCPPFVEIFDIPNLDVEAIEAPPFFEVQTRLYGDPSPQPSDIIDSDGVPNLLLIYNGLDQIAGPQELGSLTLNVPTGLTELQFFAQALDAQGEAVSNVGTIPIPEPNSLALLIIGALCCIRYRTRRR